MILGLLLAVGPSCGPTAPSACSPTNCNTCCGADGVCVKSPDNAKVASCGNNGGACTNCGTRGCVNFSCGGAGGGGGASCGPGGTCAGCCSGTSNNSICISATSSTNCGSKGEVCRSCQAGEVCSAGACLSTDGGGSQVGIACTGDDDCAALGSGHICKQHTSIGQAAYTGGYCTRECVLDADCPGSALCLGAQAGYGEGDSVCWARCTTAADCRPGYDCYGVGGGDSACWIAPLPSFDAGPPADKIGQTCASDSACQHPPDDGLCLFDSLSDGGPSPFLNGYCTAACDDSSHCGGGGAKCLSISGFGLCVAGCSGPLQGQSDCRSGYVCRPVRDLDGGMLADGFCWPSCKNAGGGCGTTATCLTTGYCG